MISSALGDMAHEEGRALPVPSAEGPADNADLIELLPLSVEAELPGR